MKYVTAPSMKPHLHVSSGIDLNTKNLFSVLFMFLTGGPVLLRLTGWYAIHCDFRVRHEFQLQSDPNEEMAAPPASSSTIPTISLFAKAHLARLGTIN